MLKAIFIVSITMRILMRRTKLILFQCNSSPGVENIQLRPRLEFKTCIFAEK